MTVQNEAGVPFTTIEIEGQKFVVDLRTAKKVEHYAIGDRVKVLIKDYSGYKAHPGVIVGIDAFKNLPTIVVAYMPQTWGSEAKIEFAYLNANSKETELAPMSEDDVLPTRETVLTAFATAIATKQREIDELATKRDYFLRRFGTVFGVGATEVAAATAPV